MSVVIDIPKQTEQALREQWGDLEQAAKEALLIESYRGRKISLGFLAEAMGMRVIEADRWLAERGVGLNYSSDDLDADRRALADLGDRLRA
jgi:predicted HTH domain antitoxin